MKYLILLFCFAVFGNEPPNPSKLYIAANIDGTFEILLFFDGKDSLKYLLAKKVPGMDYDFYGTDNLKTYRKFFDKPEVGQTYKYSRKGDSLFYTADGGLLKIISKGVFKGGAITMTSVYKFEGSVVKIVPNQRYRAY